MNMLPKAVILFSVSLSLFFLLSNPFLNLSAAPYQQDIPSPVLTPAPGLEGELQNTPVLPVFSERVREIYEAGQTLGNNPHVFSKVGDSNSASPQFLTQIDAGNYDLGNYSYLQETVDYFSGSFALPSQTAHGGFNFTAVVDPFVSDLRYCESDESPLECEYRVNRPVIAFIMFGTNDLYDLSTENFQKRLDQIIQISLEHGVVPILTSYIQQREGGFWGKTLEYNAIMLDMAQKYDIPLLNFWLAALTLPGYGISTDSMHLSSAEQEVSFNGAETEGGHDLRNLLTLLVLDQFRQEIIISE